MQNGFWNPLWKEKFTVRKYLYFATRSSNEIESYTDKNWGIPDFPDVLKKMEEKKSEYAPYLPFYDYLVYLRHHGYPSPLLDWTESPYIAAYFSMCDGQNDGYSAVYAYIETPEGSKSVDVTRANINLLGPFVSTDKRHFAQKAWYTIASTWSERNEEHEFCSHHDVFNKNDDDQDILIKIIIPRGDRRLALRELNDYNINHFTLFQNEDSLIKAISMKDFDLRDETD